MPVTSQAPAPPPAAGAQEAPPAAPPAATSEITAASAAARSNEAGEEVTFKAVEQEKRGNLFILRGDAEIDFRTYSFHADEMTYDSRSGEATATGHVVLRGGEHDDHVEAGKGSYNLKSGTGKFYDVTGTIGVQYLNGQTSFSSSNPLAFSGKEVDKTGPDRYVVLHGTVTSCKLPNPKWIYSGSKIVIDVGDRASLYNSVFKVKGVPVFYFPYATHPVERLPRQSGFLIPNYGSSGRKGTVVGDAFYWAINRSMDAQLGAEYYSKRGWSQRFSYRAKPGPDSFLYLGYFGVLDNNGDPTSHQDQGGREITLTGESRLDRYSRLFVKGDYLSSFVFRLAFATSFSEVLNSEVSSSAFYSRTQNGYFVNVFAERYQNFQSSLRDDVIQILHTPSVSFASVERPVVGSKLQFAFDASGSGLSRREPLFATADLVGRLDIYPRLSLPIAHKGWTFRPELGAHETYYSQRRLPLGGIGTVTDQPTNRHAVDTSFELRPPALSRVFTKKLFGQELKHAIEPRIIYHYVRGVDNFENVIRFDGSDILADTNELQYGLTNRLYAKGYHCETYVPEQTEVGPATTRVKPVTQCGRSAREVLTWDVALKTYFNHDFSGAVVPGVRNVLAATTDLTGIAFLTERRSQSPVISRLRVHASRNVTGTWNFDYDPVTERLNTSYLDLGLRLGDFFTSGGHAFLRAPGELFTTGVSSAPNKFSQYNFLLGYGHSGKRGFSAAGSVGIDASKGVVQSSGAQWNYNWDCCGFGLEYRRFNLGPLRSEDQLRVNFTLINIGTFGTLGRNERLY